MSDINEDIEQLIELKKRCKSFRVLVIGRANAGKTTICQKMCNSTQAAVARDTSGNMVKVSPSNKRGVHDINTEITYPDNPGFIFHDSCGLEAGSDVEKDIIFEFIRSRSLERDLSDQLHCIWFCIPMNDGRPWIEAEKSFFTQDRSKVPTILVFTKCDALENKYFHLEPKTLTIANRRKNVQKRISEELEELTQQAKASVHGPDAVVHLQNMHKEQPDCADLTDATLASLNMEALKMLLMSVKASNLDACVTAAVHGFFSGKLATKQALTEWGMQQYIFGWFPHYKNLIPGSSRMHLRLSKRLEFVAGVLIIIPLALFTPDMNIKLTQMGGKFDTARKIYNEEVAGKVSEAIRSADLDSMNFIEMEKWFLDLVLQHSMIDQGVRMK
ncbi:hypothetical protein DL96DRAFT_1620975 [Flagelloscypha sp. PMI_526]|nr:hypothetical protein DL96DRAFT_1620975 [Flagelloscypha sp. PMI_526]